MPHKRAKRSARESDRRDRGEDLAPKSAEALYDEPIPKSASRVLNAAKIREEWKAAKRKREEAGNNNDEGKQKVPKRRKLNDTQVSDVSTIANAKKRKKEIKMSKQLTIKPGESIQHFNRRVEDDMRPLIKSAVHASNVIHRNATSEKRNHKGAKNEERGDPPEDTVQQQRVSARSSEKLPGNKAKEFEKHSSSIPRRLNDIAQAPPELKHLPRGAGGSSSGNRNSGNVATKHSSREGVLSMFQREMIEKERQNVIDRYRELKARRLLETN